MLEQDLKLGATQCCLSCDEVKPLEQGEAIIRYGSFIEFTCYQCKDKKTTQEKKNNLFSTLEKDFSDVLKKHFSSFIYSDIENETWAFLTLFLDEAIAQLLEKENN